MLIPASLIIGMILIVFSACSGKTDDASPIDGVSDEVYEQLVQNYFFWSTGTDILLGNIEPEEEGSKWYSEHKLMDDAVQYAEEHEEIDNAISVFPNPLLYEYLEDPDAYSEKEQSYMEKMLEFIEAANRVTEDYESLKETMKDDLEIDDSDNIFDVS